MVLLYQVSHGRIKIKDANFFRTLHVRYFHFIASNWYKRWQFWRIRMQIANTVRTLEIMSVKEIKVYKKSRKSERPFW